MKNADAKNDAEFSTNAVSRPHTAATTPPSEAPIASIADHVPVETALAATSWCRGTMSGTVDDRAGSKKPDAPTVTAVTTYASQTVDGVRTSSRPRIITPRTTSAAIMMRRRSKRSMMTPAVGPTSAIGRICATISVATTRADPVNSNSSAYRAT